jgi:hypothetical protein
MTIIKRKSEWLKKVITIEEGKKRVLKTYVWLVFYEVFIYTHKNIKI